MVFEDKLRATVSEHVSLIESGLYMGVAALLILAAFLGVFQAAVIVWHGIRGGAIGNSGISALDQLLVVLMLVEILHTVRISIRTHTLAMVPFLVVGLIACIRRVLVVTVQAARLTEHGQGMEAAQAMFRESMIELAVLAVLILVFVFSIARFHGDSASEDTSLG